MSRDYAALAQDAAASKPVRDFSAVWGKLTPLEAAPEQLRERVEAFCSTKRISIEGLEALGTRLAVRGRGPDHLLAWASRASPSGPVTGVKYRHLTTGERSAETGSTYPLPNVIGEPSALDYFVAEGETDAARLYGLVGDAAAVLVLPAGAETFQRQWAAVIPRGATVFLAYDADRCGDAGARKAAQLLGGRTVRLRPPDEGSDWCAWPGDRDAFVRLVFEAKAKTRSRVKTYDELLAQYVEERSGPELEPVRLGWGSIDADIRGVSAGQVLGIAARTAVGKTWALASVAEAFAVREDAAALVLSLEMPGVEWAERQLAIHADVAPEEVETRAREGTLGPLAAPFLERMRNAVVIDESLALNELPAAFDDARGRLTAPLRLVLVDYLGLLNADGRDAYERASALGKGLKQLAKSEELAVIVAMQVSRAGGDGTEPVTLSMLRDSGVLEESLDFLIGCWRPGKAQNLNPEDTLALRDVMRVSVLKNRKGADGRTVDLRFRELSRRVYEPTEAG